MSCSLSMTIRKPKVDRLNLKTNDDGILFMTSGRNALIIYLWEGHSSLDYYHY